jgi:hypothetical protein
MTVDWRGWTRGQWALRLVIVLGPLVAVLARTPALGAPSPWFVALVLVLAAGWAVLPESVIGSVALLVVGLSWASQETATVPAGALLAAFGMIAAHVASLVASYGPPRLPVDPRVVRLWALRGLAVFGAGVLVFVLARTVARLPASASVWVVGLVVALSVIVVAAAAIQASTPQEDA